MRASGRRKVDVDRFRSILVAVLAVVVSGSPVRAESVQVLAAGAAQGVIRHLEPAYVSITGHKLDALFDAVGALRDRVLAGDAAHVVVLSEAAGRRPATSSTSRMRPDAFPL